MKEKTFLSWLANNFDLLRLGGIPDWKVKSIFKAGYQACLDSLPKKRGSQYNKYYWKIVCGIPSKWTFEQHGEAGGYSPDDIHELHKDHFWDELPYKEIRIGNAVTQIAMTTILNNAQFDKWIKDKLIPWWASQGVMIYLPEEKELWNSYLKEVGE